MALKFGSFGSPAFSVNDTIAGVAADRVSFSVSVFVTAVIIVQEVFGIICTGAIVDIFVIRYPRRHLACVWLCTAISRTVGARAA